MPIGHITKTGSLRSILARAQRRAERLPDLLVEAQKVANVTVAGWHGRRKRGVGENFWQFRPYVEGETLARIDWRRSARDDHTYVRDNEWEAAQTVWVWADQSASMQFQSSLARTDKQARALVLALALTEVLSRNGERVGYLGLSEARATRNNAELITERLIDSELGNEIPSFHQIRSRADVVLFSDFMRPMPELIAALTSLKARPVRVFLVEVADPAEAQFPYLGRTEFIDPETGQKLMAGRAEAIAEDYRQAYQKRRLELADWCRKTGWQFVVNSTDQLASGTLVRLHRLIGAPHAAGAVH